MSLLKPLAGRGVLRFARMLMRAYRRAAGWNEDLLKTGQGPRLNRVLRRVAGVWDEEEGHGGEQRGC